MENSGVEPGSAVFTRNEFGSVLPSTPVNVDASIVSARAVPCRVAFSNPLIWLTVVPSVSVSLVSVTSCEFARTKSLSIPASPNT